MIFFQPLDFIMSRVHELLFTMDPIPEAMLAGLTDYHLVSGNPTHARRYLLILAETCNVRQELKIHTLV